MSCPVANTAQRHPGALALIFEGRRWTYRDLDREVREWASRLHARGVRPGDRLALLTANRPEAVFLLFATRRLGATLVPLNARLTATELSALLEQLNPVHRLASEVLAERLGECWILEALAAEKVVHPSTALGMNGGTIEISAGDRSQAGHGERSRAGTGADGDQEHPSTALGMNGGAPGMNGDGGGSDVWAMLFTSGTTGRAKAVEITEANLFASARASGANLGSDAGQRWLGNLPLFHVGGIAMAVRCAIYGCALELESGFDLDRAIAALRSPKLTHASLVPQTLARVVEAGPLRFSASLRALLIGGGPSRPELLAEARSHGLPVLQTYGLTEACSQVATERLAEADGQSAGRPLEGLSVRIVAGDGTVLGAGAEGEIQVRGDTVMRGYFRDPAATEKVLQDGWLRTGDIGALDDRGRLHVFARRSDLILSGGENIYPAELERVLGGHPSVAEVAVLGASDPRWGQVPVAVMVARGAADAGAVEEWCRTRLAGFKVPRRWIWVDALPRNAGGKVDRAALRELFSAPETLRATEDTRRG